jgi:transketolase
MSIEKSKKLADFIRISAVKMTNKGKSSHVASVLSMADVLGVLYGDYLNVNPDEPKTPDRDIFILSKGHAGAGVYAALAWRGFFSKSVLDTHYQNGSILSGHVSHKNIPGVEFSTGSLGHGLPASIGFAMARKELGSRVVCVMGDGECNEGTTWESALLASHYNLNNLTVIIDCNKFQSLKTTKETLNLEPFAQKWESFGWDVFDIDGHDIKAISAALNSNSKKPKCIIANTIKGNGVDFMENNILWHYRSPQNEEYELALEKLKNYER